MSITQTEGIVLNRYAMGDSSLLVTVFTRAFGKIKLVAKGARKSRTQRSSALEPFTHVSVSFRRKENRDLQILNQVEIVTSYRYIGDDLVRMSYAGAVSELVNRLVIGEEPSDGLFNLLLDVLTSLNNAASEAGALIFWSFQLRFAAIFGYPPHMDNCVSCNHESHVGEAFFSAAMGGMICRQCKSQDPGAFLVFPGSVRLLAGLQSLPMSRVARFRTSTESSREIRRVIRSFFAYHMEDTGDYKSLKFLDSINQVSGEPVKPTSV